MCVPSMVSVEIVGFVSMAVKNNSIYTKSYTSKSTEKYPAYLDPNKPKSGYLFECLVLLSTPKNV